MSINTTRNDKILEITIDRPKANAIDALTSRELGKVFHDFMADSELRVAILTGSGTKFFSAGWDLNAANEGEAFESDYGVGGFGGLSELDYRPKPVIAAVNGMAVGGGFEIALSADFIVAAEHATFFLPETTLGIIADNATVRLPRMLPPNIAREMLIGGKRMSAAEAQSWGIVNEVAPSGLLLETARQLAQKICLSAPLSVTAVLDLMRSVATLPLNDAVVAMRNNQAYQTAIASLDAQEGTTAFSEKREPNWLGR